MTTSVEFAINKEAFVPIKSEDDLHIYNRYGAKAKGIWQPFPRWTKVIWQRRGIQAGIGVVRAKRPCQFICDWSWTKKEPVSSAISLLSAKI